MGSRSFDIYVDPVGCVSPRNVRQGNDGEQDDRRNVKPVRVYETSGPLALYNESRALIIAGSNYDHFPPLPETEQDATAVEKALKRSGFDVETPVSPDREQLVDAILRFIQRWGKDNENVENRLIIYLPDTASR